MINREFHNNNFIGVYYDEDARLLALLKCRPDSSLYVALINDERETVKTIELKDIFISVSRHFSFDQLGTGGNPYLRDRAVYEDLMTTETLVERPFKRISYLKHFELNVATQRILLQAYYTQFPKDENVALEGTYNRRKEDGPNGFMLLNFDGELTSEQIINHDDDSIYRTPYFPVRFFDRNKLMYMGNDLGHDRLLQFWDLNTGQHLQPGMPVLDQLSGDEKVLEEIDRYSFNADKRLLALYLRSRVPAPLNAGDDEPEEGASALKIFTMDDQYRLTPLSGASTIDYKFSYDKQIAVSLQGDELAVLNCAPPQLEESSPYVHIETYRLADLTSPLRVIDIDFPVHQPQTLHIEYLSADALMVMHADGIFIYSLSTGRRIEKLLQDAARVYHRTGDKLYFTYGNILYVYDTVNGQRPQYPSRIRNKGTHFNGGSNQYGGNTQGPSYETPLYERSSRSYADGESSKSEVWFYLRIGIFILWILWKLMR